MTTASRMLRQLGMDTQYALLGLPFAIITFVLSVVGFAFGTGTAVLVLGLTALVGTLFMVRGFATVERARVAPVLGRRLPHPRYRRVAAGSGFWRRIITTLGDGQAWLDLLHSVFRLIPAVISFVFVVVWWSGTIGGLTFPLWDWSIPRGAGDQSLPELLGLGDSFITRNVFHVGLGVLFALTLYPVVRGAALMQALFSRALLTGVHELREQVTQAEAARDTAQAQKAAAVSAEATALRRLERDIHDGPQQRLVRLAMDLGRAEQQFETNPAAARATVAEALAQTRETLDELRALSRGIAPPILVDRGLNAALIALAGRSTIPVDLEASEFGRLEPAAESTAYFVVAESLTNAAKHSLADEIRVVVRQAPTGLLVIIRDDGMGGASLAKGHGLAGLTDRVQAAGGVLTVDSPHHGGTTITAVLPG